MCRGVFGALGVSDAVRLWPFVRMFLITVADLVLLWPGRSIGVWPGDAVTVVIFDECAAALFSVVYGLGTLRIGLRGSPTHRRDSETNIILKIKSMNDTVCIRRTALQWICNGGEWFGV